MGDGYNILVVDDDAGMREFLELLLTKENYRVSTARTGKQAVNMI